MNKTLEILSPELFMLAIVIIMILFGAFGGCINYLIARQKAIRGDGKTDSVSLLYSVILGIGASFLVPLFLSLLSSDIIDRLEGGHTDFFIFGSLCLIAGISSDSFIQVVSRNMIKKLSKAVNTDGKALENSVVQSTQNVFTAAENAGQTEKGSVPG
ncbi:MAG: hypothetical protein N3I35_15155 [Clostridia bacterium]|nr:hypothetical protein [Clostridia bacterium]